ncbi:hypothetical protein JG688_00015769 [Phytophthora aleatoria]|uniref:HAT C-terminal dimerisation domain-containing protein n=1 Tax=Phytophthora aleatoria TaxID=2496075 RepID=A0A8J5LZC5_9STRA|nr:hypothetical protein JG688_00015769 [Phytophthora aleatoria]
MKFTNKDHYTLLFTELSPNQARCNTCLKVHKSDNGYTNQVHHLLKRHPDYQELAVAAFRKGNRFGLSLPDQRTSDVFRWIEWSVMERMPVSFCERPLVRENAKMEPISAATLQKYIERTSRHFIAIMAVFEDPSVFQPKKRDPDCDESMQCLTRRFVLLVFCPLGDEEDLGAQSLFDLIADTLSIFNSPWESVLFMIGDNCSVNQAIYPMAKIHALMKHLSTIKCRAPLRKVTPLAPVMRNVTRWSSVFGMVERYNKLHPALLAMDHASMAKHDIAHFLLTEEESTQAKELQEVSKARQDPTLTLVGVRRAFDWVVRQYPPMKERLASDAAVVSYPAFETGITNIISGGRLTTREQEACKGFKCGAAAPPTEKATRSVLVFQKVTPARTKYMQVAWMPPTSNECERYFSQAKMVCTDMRKSMDANTIEVLMFLACNRDSWDVGSVQATRRKMRN